jgi:hypothetical protein
LAQISRARNGESGIGEAAAPGEAYGREEAGSGRQAEGEEVNSELHIDPMRRCAFCRLPPKVGIRIHADGRCEAFARCQCENHVSEMYASKGELMAAMQAGTVRWQRHSVLGHHP